MLNVFDISMLTFTFKGVIIFNFFVACDFISGGDGITIYNFFEFLATLSSFSVSLRAALSIPFLILTK